MVIREVSSICSHYINAKKVLNSIHKTLTFNVINIFQYWKLFPLSSYSINPFLPKLKEELKSNARTEITMKNIMQTTYEGGL